MRRSPRVVVSIGGIHPAQQFIEGIWRKAYLARVCRLQHAFPERSLRDGLQVIHALVEIPDLSSDGIEFGQELLTEGQQQVDVLRPAKEAIDQRGDTPDVFRAALSLI